MHACMRACARTKCGVGGIDAIMTLTTNYLPQDPSGTPDIQNGLHQESLSRTLNVSRIKRDSKRHKETWTRPLEPDVDPETMDTSLRAGRGPKDNGHGSCSLSFLANTSQTLTNRNYKKHQQTEKTTQKLCDEKLRTNIYEYSSSCFQEKIFLPKNSCPFSQEKTFLQKLLSIITK